MFSISCNIPEIFGMALVIAYEHDKIDCPNRNILSNFETSPRGFIPRGATIMGHNLPRNKQSTCLFKDRCTHSSSWVSTCFCLSRDGDLPL